MRGEERVARGEHSRVSGAMASVEDPDDIAAKQALLNRLNEMKEQSQTIAQKIAGQEPGIPQPACQQPGKKPPCLNRT